MKILAWILFLLLLPILSEKKVLILREFYHTSTRNLELEIYSPTLIIKNNNNNR